MGKSFDKLQLVEKELADLKAQGRKDWDDLQTVTVAFKYTTMLLEWTEAEQMELLNAARTDPGRLLRMIEEEVNYRKNVQPLEKAGAAADDDDDADEGDGSGGEGSVN